jgi:hypothetical protein
MAGSSNWCFMAIVHESRALTIGAHPQMIDRQSLFELAA